MGQDPDRLPLLQHALMRMWTRAAARPDWDRVFRLGNYPPGGLAAALSAHCDEVYEALTDDQRRLAEIMFRALCARSGALRDTRRPQRVHELAAVAALADPADIYPVIEAFSRADRCFLTGSGAGDLCPDTVVDIGHESLIAHWERLSKWVAAEEESAREYRRLADSADLYARNHGALRDGADVARLLEWRGQAHHNPAWASRYGGGYEEAMAYLDKCRTEQVRLERERERQQARSTRQLRIWLGIVSALLVLTFGAALRAWDREQVAAEQRKAALESRAKWFAEIARSKVLVEPQGSLLLTLEANRAAPQLIDTETLISETLAQVGGTPLIGHEAGVTAIAYTPDGRTLASGSRDGTLRLWDPSHPGAVPRILRGYGGDVTAVAFAPDGRTLASGSDDKTIRLWDPTRPKTPPLVLHGHEGQVSTVVFAPDGATLASGSEDKTIRLWDPSHPEAPPRVLCGHGDAVTSIAFAPDGRTLASGSWDKTVRLWDATDPTVKSRSLRGHGEAVSALAFAPDGRTLASASWDRTIRLWDPTDTEAARQELRGHEGAVTAVAFAPDGHSLASGSVDTTVRIWDPTHPEAPRVLRGHDKPVIAVAFAPDGRTLASASEDQTVRLWDLTRPGAEPRVLHGHELTVTALAFAPDGRTLASGSWDTTVRLWDLDLDLTRLRRLACARLARNLSQGESRVLFGTELPAKTCVEIPVHPSFLRIGDTLAEDGKVSEAASSYRQVLASFDSREFDPLVRAAEIRRLAAHPWRFGMADGHSVHIAGLYVLLAAAIGAAATLLVDRHELRQDASAQAKQEVARMAAERSAAGAAARQAAEQQRGAQQEVARQAAERQAAEEAARQAAERQAEQEAARQAAERRAEQEAARQAAERKARQEAARQAAEQQVEQEAALQAAGRKATQEAARQAAKRKAEQEAARQTAERKAANAPPHRAVKPKPKPDTTTNRAESPPPGFSARASKDLQEANDWLR